jgi:hypothetical protein
MRLQEALALVSLLLCFRPGTTLRCVNCETNVDENCAYLAPSSSSCEMVDFERAYSASLVASSASAHLSLVIEHSESDETQHHNSSVADVQNSTELLVACLRSHRTFINNPLNHQVFVRKCAYLFVSKANLGARITMDSEAERMLSRMKRIRDKLVKYRRFEECVVEIDQYNSSFRVCSYWCVDRDGCNGGGFDLSLAKNRSHGHEIFPLMRSFSDGMSTSVMYLTPFYMLVGLVCVALSVVALAVLGATFASFLCYSRQKTTSSNNSHELEMLSLTKLNEPTNEVRKSSCCCSVIFI